MHAHLFETAEYWWKSPKNREKSQNLINAQDLIIAQGGFFSKNNKRTVSNKHAQGGFFPKTINVRSTCIYKLE